MYTAPGNDHTCLEAFFSRLRHARAPLRAIAVDMSKGYAKAIREYGPPGVVVVFDKFHIVAQMNQVIEAVRRSEQNRLSAEGKSVFACKRGVWSRIC
jgi:transposase